MITLDDYWMGRQQPYAAEWTPEIQANAAVTVDKANRLLNAFFAANLSAATRKVNSGWRPAAVNATVPKAKKGSKHLTAQAIDLSDDDGALDAWLATAAGLHALAAIGLWAEHPSATPRWAHVQTVPPASGNRIFYP